MNKKFLILEDQLKIRNQFKRSQLTDEIIHVVGCDVKTALALQKKHCNLLSFWALLYADNKTTMLYDEFFFYCFTHKLPGGKPYATPGGYVNIDKDSLMKSLGLNTLEYKLKSIPADRQPGDLYRLSLNGNKHFIACCVADDLTVCIFDTNDRGCPEEIGRGLAKKHDKPDWFKIIK